MNPPIRILNLFTNMNYGGAETMVMNYYRNIDRTKVQFDFMVHREQRGAYDDEIEALGGRIYRMIPIYPQNFGKYKRMISDFFDKHTEYKIIHSHMSELGYFVFKEAKKRGISVRICHAHNAPHGWDMKMFVRTYFKWKNKKLITHMFICGQEAGNWLFGKNNSDQFIMMNNAIDARKYIVNDEIRAKVRREFALNDELVIGHVGRFNPQKNHSFLIDVFYEILKLSPNSKLMLVGSGDGRQEIESKCRKLHIENQVIFTGSRLDVNELMQAMDAFVFPSLFEGLPVTMVEAQAAGLPCYISSQIPQQCILTDIVQSVDLQTSPKKWAEIIVKSAQTHNRPNTYDVIMKSGFDIISAAEWLENFYISKYKELNV